MGTSGHQAQRSKALLRFQVLRSLLCVQARAYSYFAQFGGHVFCSCMNIRHDAADDDALHVLDAHDVGDDGDGDASDGGDDDDDGSEGGG